MKTALYYPLVDPNNDALLLNALLYWDELLTIVPESLRDPYQRPLTQELQKLGVLKSEIINSNSEYVEEAGNDILSFLDKEELGDLLIENGRADDFLYLEKLSPQLANTLEYSRMYPDKLPAYIRHSMNSMGNDSIRVEKNFAKIYMALLAKKIALCNGYTTLTDSSVLYGLPANSSYDQLSRTRNLRHYDRFESRINNYDNAIQGMKITATMDMFKLTTDIKPEKILKFKEKYTSELCQFRKAIELIKPNIAEEMKPSAVLSQIEDRVRNEVIPAVSNLKKACEGNGFMLLPNTMSVATTMAIPAVGFFNLGNMTKPEALGVSMAVYLATSLIKMRKERADSIRTNSYSYLFHIEQELN